MAPLAESAQIVQPIVGWVTVEMRGRKNNARHSESRRFHQVRPSGRSPTAIAPSRCPLIEPASVRQTTHQGKMWTGTALAQSSGTLEANSTAQFPPVRWVEGTQLRADRHRYIPSLTTARLSGEQCDKWRNSA
jgi:hypothetical protein